MLGPQTASQPQNEEVNSRAASQVLSLGKREEFACDLLKLADEFPSAIKVIAKRINCNYQMVVSGIKVKAGM